MSAQLGTVTEAEASQQQMDFYDEDDDSYDDAQECYHEIHAIPLLDPVLDKQVGGW
jgi:hypothetical protein